MTSLIPPALLLGNNAQKKDHSKTNPHSAHNAPTHPYPMAPYQAPNNFPLKPDRMVTRDRMHELEMSHQSHAIMLLKTEVNNKDLEIVEFKAQLQDYRMKCEKLLKEKDKVIQERNQANSSLREELEMKMQMIGALQKDIRSLEGRHQLFNNGTGGVPNAVIESHTKELSRRLREKEAEIARIHQDKEDALSKLSIELNHTKQKCVEQERQSALLAQALRDRAQKDAVNGELTQKQNIEAQTRVAEVENALRQARSRNTTLEAELSVSRAEAANGKALLGDSERAVAVLREKVKALDEQLRLIEPKARDLQKVQELILEVEQVHTEKSKLRSQVHKLNEDRVSLGAQLEALQEEMARRESQLEILENKYDQQTGVVLGLKQDISRKDRTLRDIEARVREEFERKLRDATSEVTQLRVKLDSISSNTLPLRDELAIAHNDRQQLTHQVEELREELGRRTQQLDDVMRNQLQGPYSFTTHMSELESLTELQSRSLTELHAELKQRDTLLGQLQAENQSKINVITQLKAELDERDRRMRQLEATLQRLEHTYAGMHNQGQEATAQDRNMEVLVHELEADQVRYRAEIKVQLEELQRKGAQIDKLEKTRNELLADNKSLRGQLLAKSNLRANGVPVDVEDKRTIQRAKYEVESCVAELASLRQLMKQAQMAQGQEVSMDGNESIIHTPSSSNNLLDCISAIKQEVAALRTAFTTVYAESLGNNCAVQ